MGGKMSDKKYNVDEGEIAKFSRIADKWWDKSGEFKTLHDINPLRLDYIDGHADLCGKRVLDVGCGGGILAESMARRGAAFVKGIDMAEQSLETARLHAALNNVADIEYECIRVEDLAEAEPHSFDVVTCMEMMEHVPDPAAIVRACANLVKPDGMVFFSTINKTRIVPASDCGGGISVEVCPQRHARLEKIHRTCRAGANVPSGRLGCGGYEGYDLPCVVANLCPVRFDRCELYVCLPSGVLTAGLPVFEQVS